MTDEIRKHINKLILKGKLTDNEVKIIAYFEFEDYRDEHDKIF